jgi:hypothetical protein
MVPSALSPPFGRCWALTTVKGFVGEHTGDHVTITNVALNGVACTMI